MIEAAKPGKVMRNAYLIETSIIVLNIVFLGVSVFVAVNYTVLAGVAAFLALSALLAYWIYSHDAWLVRRLTTDEQPLSLSLCKSGFVGRARTLMRLLPSSPRCRLCLAPFAGAGTLLHIKPSAENPNFCRSCFEGLPTGTLDLDVGIMFVDMRGFTQWSEGHTPAETARLLSRFYDDAAQEITRDDALIEFIGDEVMAIYPVPMASLGERAADVMLKAARRVLRSMREEPGLPGVGIGMHIGVAQVGEMAMGATRNFTAVGDVVNTASRLQSAAASGEILVSEAFFERLSSRPKAKLKVLDLKGKKDLVRAYVVSGLS